MTRPSARGGIAGLALALGVAATPLAAQPAAGGGVAASVPQQLSGQWELDLTRSEFGPMPRPASMTRRLDVTPRAFDMAITQRTPGGDVSGLFHCAIGGDPCRNKQGPTETTGSARWDQGALVVTTTLSRLLGPDLTTVDRYRVSEDGRVLTMERTFEAAGTTSPSRGRLVFARR